jgi:hypothetical protein
MGDGERFVLGCDYECVEVREISNGDLDWW